MEWVGRCRHEPRESGETGGISSPDAFAARRQKCVEMLLPSPAKDVRDTHFAGLAGLTLECGLLRRCPLVVARVQTQGDGTIFQLGEFYFRTVEIAVRVRVVPPNG